MSSEADLVVGVCRWLIGPALDCLMIAASRLAMPLALLLPIGLWTGRRRRAGLSLGLILVGSSLGSVALQFILLRPRPPGIDPSAFSARFPSFPSGHAAVAFGYATFAIFVWHRAAVPAFAAAVLVGLSRVHLVEHHPTDVLGGAILGGAVGLTVFGWLYGRRRSSRPWWGWLLWPGLATALLAGLAANLGLLTVAFLAYPGVDKALHFALYGAVSLFAVGWWAHIKPARVLGLTGLVVLLEELLQGILPTRTVDLLDLFASWSGVAIAGCLGAAALRRANRVNENKPLSTRRQRGE
jgi:membrane-associated phospholipid phosphatase